MAGSHPAAPAIRRKGSFRARAKARRSGSADPAAPFSMAKAARASATPPPATTPSFAAARAVLSAFSQALKRAFHAVSVTPPTRMLATPETSRARRASYLPRS